MIMRGARVISHTLAVTIGAAISLPALAASGGTCAAPTRIEPAGAGKGVAKKPTDAPGIAFQKADDLRRAGRGDEAANIYQKLLSTPRDKRQTARKAQLRLAQYELSNNRFDAARELVEAATRPGANDSIRAEAAYISKRIDYDLAVSSAELKFSQLEMKRRAAEDATPLLPEYEALLSLTCPYPNDYHFELYDRMASINQDAGNFAAAKELLAKSNAELANISDQRIGTLREKLTQRAADLEARTAIASVENDPDEARKRQRYDMVLASNPAPSAQLKVRAHLLAADSYMRERNFSAAAERIELAAQIPTNELTPASVRIDRARAKLAERKADHEFRERLQEINALRSLDARAAIPQYRVLIDQNSRAPALPLAKVALADAMRQARYYGESRAILAELSQQQNPANVSESIARLQQNLEKNSPDSSLRAQVRIAGYYDTNAPTLATELREEDDGIAYPLNQKFDDGVIDLDARIAHSARISSSYHYWDTELHARKTEQFSLSPIDRLVLDVNSGPRFNLPDQAAQLRVAGLFKWESRGSEFLRSNYGGTVALEKRVSRSVDAEVVFTAIRNNDTRDFLDGTFLTLRSSIDFRIDRAQRLSPLVTLERRETRDPRFDNSRLAIGGSYSRQWGEEGLRKGVDLDVRYQWVRYDRDPGVLPRNDRRFQAGVTGWMDLTPKIRAFAEFRHNNPSSNYTNLERLANDRIGAGLIFTID